MTFDLLPAYLLAILIGLSLGLIGSGGSILAVPVLVYIVGVKPVEATGYSLFIVGVSAFIGTIDYARRKLIDFKTALKFGLPSLLAVFVMRSKIVPLIPKHFNFWQGFSLTKDTLMMVVFALLMFGASISILRKPKERKDTKDTAEASWLQLGSIGLLVGILTGLVGVGGGFMIIPALILLANIPIRFAVGTSLFIITINSVIGFAGNMIGSQNVNWSLVLSFTAMSCIGIFIGGKLSKNMSAANLRIIFGYFLLFIATYILTKELFL